MLPKRQKPRTPASSYVITLTNITENETFCYSLPIIKGYVTVYSQDSNSDKEKSIILRKLTNGNNPEEVTIWPVINGNFKCLANLNLGRNHFIMEYEDASLCLNLEFKSKTTNYHVLPVYIICDGHDGNFQAPEEEDNTPESACRRISLGSRLIQSLTAEKLQESDMSRRTFQLAYDMDIDLDCIVFHSKLSSDDVYQMEPEEIWEHFGRELMSSPYGSDQRKFLAFLSCTRYISDDDKEPETHEEIVARMQGHVALGGGGLAIFGTGCLHTWPETIDQIVTKFTDETKVDKTKFMDDSCYRGTYGSCFSTTLGSVCHELGHTFDLGHSKKGIMGRGFDNINLVFTICNQSKDANKNVITRNEAQHATVCFTRDLNVTYTMSSPIKRPRGRFQGLRHNSPQRRISTESDVIKTWNPKSWSTDVHYDNEKRQINYSKIAVDDLTFWDRSCAVILRYHRWFANNDIPDNMLSSIDFDSHRNIISSTSGIRVIELRGEDGLVLASWEFLSTYIPKQFTLPVQNMDMNDIKMVVAEDSMGNIIKETLVTG